LACNRFGQSQDAKRERRARLPPLLCTCLTSHRCSCLRKLKYTDDCSISLYIPFSLRLVLQTNSKGVQPFDSQNCLPHWQRGKTVVGSFNKHVKPSTADPPQHRRSPSSLFARPPRFFRVTRTQVVQALCYSLSSLGLFLFSKTSYTSMHGVKRFISLGSATSEQASLGLGGKVKGTMVSSLKRLKLRLAVPRARSEPFPPSQARSTLPSKSPSPSFSRRGSDASGLSAQDSSVSEKNFQAGWTSLADL
jgi:hypothetical protein